MQSHGASPTPLHMETFTAVVERSTEAGLHVGDVPGFSGAHPQGATLEEADFNLKEVVSMLLEDGPAPKEVFVCVIEIH